MKALTVRRPWAQLIILGVKDIENRQWTVSYRGPLVIHAGQAWEEEGAAMARELHPERDDAAWQAALHRQGAATGYLGVVDLVNICTKSRRGGDCDCGPWASRGEYHWRLGRPRPFRHPVPGRGALGLREVPAQVEELATTL